MKFDLAETTPESIMHVFRIIEDLGKDPSLVRSLTAEEFLDLLQEVTLIGASIFGEEVWNHRWRNPQVIPGETIVSGDRAHIGTVKSEVKNIHKPKLFGPQKVAQQLMWDIYSQANEYKKRLSIPGKNSGEWKRPVSDAPLELPSETRKLVQDAREAERNAIYFRLRKRGVLK